MQYTCLLRLPAYGERNFVVLREILRTHANRVACERILDTLHVGLITGAMYWYCITNFTNLEEIQRPIWCVFSSASNDSGVFTSMDPPPGPSLYVQPRVKLPCSFILTLLYRDEGHDRRVGE